MDGTEQPETTISLSDDRRDHRVEVDVGGPTRHQS